MHVLKCFVIMPFDERFDEVYESIQIAASGTFERTTVAIERLDGPKLPVWLIDHLRQSLVSADLCIADLTGLNANVMWEAGYAMGAGKTVIALSQDISELPFDLRPYFTLSYDSGKLDDLVTNLRKMLSKTVPRILATLNAIPGDEDSLLDFLLKAVEKSDHRAMIGRFKTEGSLLIRYLLSEHRDGYREALRRALYDRCVRLNTRARMAAARKALEHAQRNVRAIALLGNDPWSEQDAYSELICRVAPHLTQGYRRIVIFDRSPISEEQSQRFRTQRAAGVEFRVAPRDVVQRIEGTIELQNLLIVDEEMMTQSIQESNHEGDLVQKKNSIMKQVERFDNLWLALSDYRGEFGGR